MEALSRNQLQEFSDEDLMEHFQAGYEEGFNLLVKRYTDRLHNFLYRYTHDHQDCEDLVQETFLRVYRSRHSYERIAKFSTWMYTIALNLAKSLYKKKKRMTTVTIHKDPDDPEDRKIDLEDDGILQDDSLHEKMCMSQLEKALMELNENFREVVVLRDIQQLSYEEISEMTDNPMGTVKSRINRGRAQLQELLESYVHPEPNVQTGLN
ncbi:sigma-70 family RNA polymerase sigma factor [Aliifodinibius sp. S!AR15-10]|uniref:sigma-70 family RNA polymerase sigma factor n=1 Tax=Aliifodinibius sp. S!AR15-10 TaxID=2950437 RepID=UPI0028556648|nr:sigma-70 family RNA polymerase sigma factor [Aliifodinibius sp. S!AR15-10]MDR8391559.1 sigma-70 family RNA polymerase sigma factor [Aliifodinibius sp. S!AR15-10]